jgi:hypothetical protein
MRLGRGHPSGGTKPTRYGCHRAQTPRPARPWSCAHRRGSGTIGAAGSPVIRSAPRSPVAAGSHGSWLSPARGTAPRGVPGTELAGRPAARPAGGGLVVSRTSSSPPGWRPWSPRHRTPVVRGRPRAAGATSWPTAPRPASDVPWAHMWPRFVLRAHIRARVCRCRYTSEPAGRIRDEMCVGSTESMGQALFRWIPCAGSTSMGP